MQTSASTQQLSCWRAASDERCKQLHLQMQHPDTKHLRSRPSLSWPFCPLTEPPAFPLLTRLPLTACPCERSWDHTVRLFGDQAIIVYPQSTGNPGTGNPSEGQGVKYRQVSTGGMGREVLQGCVL